MSGANSPFPNLSDIGRAQADTIDRPPGLKCELKTYEARYNSTGYQVALQVGTQKHNKQRYAVERDHDSALVVTRYYNSKKDLEYTELEIKSPHVKTALQEVVGDYPGLNLHTKKLVVRNFPKFLFHYRKELHEYGTQLQDDIAREHVAFCLRYMLTTLNKEIMGYYSLMESQQIPPGLEFPDLWMAFKPGDFIFVRTHYAHRVLKLVSMSQPRCSSCPIHCLHSCWTLSAQHLDYDGREFGYIKSEFNIHPYMGYKPLHLLDAFPMKYHPEHEMVKKMLIERGKKFVSLRGVQHRQYHGIALTLSSARKTTLLGEETDSNFQTGVVCDMT
jgi:hypothetical protein